MEETTLVRGTSNLQRLRKKGFQSEMLLVNKLEELGYNAVRVPVSNPSRNPLPDVFARKDKQVYAFEVKTAKYYAYFPKKQIDKLFTFLDQFIPLPSRNKHSVLAAHFSKRWIFREITWNDWKTNRLADRESISKKDIGNFHPSR